MHVFSGILDLSDAASEASAAQRDAQLIVDWLANDLRLTERILVMAPGTLELLTANGDTIRYAWSFPAADTLWRAEGGGVPAPVAEAVDSLRLALLTVARPFTEEIDQPVAVEAAAASFSPGDWDDWMDQTSCYYESSERRRIQDEDWSAEEFFLPEEILAFTRASVRVAALDHFPAQVDLLVEIYKAASSSPRYPETLLARGRIDRLRIGAETAWQEASLSMTGATPVPSGTHCWIVWRPDGSGYSSYAGHIDVQNINGCDSDEWPGTSIHYRATDDAGDKWSLRTHRQEAFFQVHGLRNEMKLTEITRSLADTLGVSYSFRISAGEEPERRAGFIARYDL